MKVPYIKKRNDAVGRDWNSFIFILFLTSLDFLHQSLIRETKDEIEGEEREGERGRNPRQGISTFSVSFYLSSLLFSSGIVNNIGREGGDVRGR